MRSGKLLVLACMFLSQLSSAQSTSLPKQAPNIIFILADDLGYGDVGCYGQQKIKTPNIDKLAVSGMRFTQFYAGSTVCAPSRTCFMSGLHTGHTPIRGNRGVKPEGQYPLPDSTVTIAMVLEQAGYATAAFGKWALGFPGSSGVPLKKGFQRFYGYNCQTLAHDYYPDHLWSDDEKVLFPENATEHNNYSADLIHQQALEFLNKQDAHGKPFFMYLPYTLPHADLTVPHDTLYELYVKKFNEKPLPEPVKEKPGKIFEPYPHAAFAAMVSRLDIYVGEIVAAVQKKGIAYNTLIIFSSDNGPHHEDGGDPEFFNGGGGYKGVKRDLYEGGIREPFIASWKGVIKAGTVNHVPAALWDLFPTFQQLAHLPVSTNIDGLSLVPALLEAHQPVQPYFYWELHEAGGKQAVRWGTWKGIRLNVFTDANGPIELYNLQTDPAEKNNVADKNPGVVIKIAQMMQEAHVMNKDWPLFKSEGDPGNGN